MSDTIMVRGLRALLVCLLVCFTTSTVWAQPAGVDEDKGRELAQQAMAHYKNGEFHEAAGLFSQAREVYPTGQVLRMAGYTEMAIENWVEAAEILDEALASTYKPLDGDDREHAQSQLDKVLEHVGVVEVTSSVEGTEVSVDGGEPLPVPATFRLTAGEHSFIATAPDHDGVQEDQVASAGQTVNLELDPTPMVGEEPRAAPKPKPEEEPEGGGGEWFAGQGTVGLITLSLGVVVAGVGIGVGVAGNSLYGAVEENIAAHETNFDARCSTNTDLCLNDIALINADGERAHDLQTAGLYMGIAGGAVAVTGLVLFLFSEDGLADPPEEGADKASLACTPLAPLGLNPLAMGEAFAGMGCVGSF